MNCTRCNKRLSRKTARQIGGKVMCSACMFGQRPRDRDGTEGGDANAAPVPQDCQARAEGIAQTPDNQELSS